MPPNKNRSALSFTVNDGKIIYEASEPAEDEPRFSELPELPVDLKKQIDEMEHFCPLKQGLKATKIVGCFGPDQHDFVMVEYRGKDDTEVDMLKMDLVKFLYPQLLIKFYEENLKNVELTPAPDKDFEVMN